jgi:hypothetical protein
MNANNYRDVSPVEFIEIMEGLKSEYYLPQTANRVASQQMTDQALRASGIDPVYIIYVPTLFFRNRQQLEHNIRSVAPKEKWHDFNDPIVFRISEILLWNRGMNTSTGEGPKSELTLGINLQHCEFTTKFSIANVKSKADLVVDRCVFKSNTSGDGEFILASTVLPKSWTAFELV